MMRQGALLQHTKSLFKNYYESFGGSGYMYGQDDGTLQGSDVNPKKKKKNFY